MDVPIAANVLGTLGAVRVPDRSNHQLTPVTGLLVGSGTYSLR